MKKYAVLAIGYNRVNSIKRLLNSLNKAKYDDDSVTLIISIDNSGTDEVEQYAVGVDWKHGPKIIKTYPERLGLRKHILQCGDFLEEYDALAVFEDDIIASPGFYQYMKCCVEKYYYDDNIAGISMYNHLWNVNVSRPFEPALSRYDVYFMQYAQSWGQIWMKRQWREFIQWYSNNDGEFGNEDNIPEFVSNWPKSSWLKYHIKFCIEKNKYFVYPYKSLSTCFSDVGEHCSIKDTRFQVPMLIGEKNNYVLPNLADDDSVKYDSFFERVFNGKEVNGVRVEELCVDLYGNRRSYDEKKFVLSINNLPFKCVCSYGFDMKPHEENFVNNIHGKGIFLYNTMIHEKPKKIDNEILIFKYQFRMNGKKKIMMKCLIENVIHRLNKKR